MDFTFEKCQRCGSPNTANVTLGPAYKAALCLEHRREWTEYVHPLGEFASYGVAVARLEAAVNAGDPDTAGGLWLEYSEAAATLYAIAKAWAEAEPTPPEEAPDG